METQIFYWTGVFIWCCIQACVIGVVFVATILTPIYVFHRIRKHWWGFATMGRFANLGWSAEEIRKMANHARVGNDWQRKAIRVMEKAEELKKAI